MATTLDEPYFRAWLSDNGIFDNLDIFFIRESWLPGPVIVLGSLVSGGAMGWVKLRKDEAVREEQDALAPINFLKSFSGDPCRSGGRIESNH